MERGFSSMPVYLIQLRCFSVYKCTENLYTKTTTLLIILKFYDTSTDIKTLCNHLCTMVSLLSSLLRTCDCWSMN